MADIDESVYLNAARAECLIQFSYDPGFYSSDEARQRAINADTAIRARDPFLRAAVESVWAARGEHDATAIRPVREIQAAIAATARTLHTVAEWGDVGAEELHRVAEEVAVADVSDWTCCPVCEEITCDDGCPLAMVRNTDSVPPDLR